MILAVALLVLACAFPIATLSIRAGNSTDAIPVSETR